MFMSMGHFWTKYRRPKPAEYLILPFRSELGLTGVTVITRLFSTLSIVTLSIVSITRPIPNIT